MHNEIIGNQVTISIEEDESSSPTPMREEDMDVEIQQEGGRQSCLSIKLQEIEKLTRVRLP